MHAADAEAERVDGLAAVVAVVAAVLRCDARLLRGGGPGGAGLEPGPRQFAIDGNDRVRRLAQSAAAAEVTARRGDAGGRGELPMRRSALIGRADQEERSLRRARIAPQPRDVSAVSAAIDDVERLPRQAEGHAVRDGNGEVDGADRGDAGLVSVAGDERRESDARAESNPADVKIGAGVDGSAHQREIDL